MHRSSNNAHLIWNFPQNRSVASTTYPEKMSNFSNATRGDPNLTTLNQQRKKPIYEPDEPCMRTNFGANSLPNTKFAYNGKNISDAITNRGITNIMPNLRRFDTRAFSDSNGEVPPRLHTHTIKSAPKNAWFPYVRVENEQNKPADPDEVSSLKSKIRRFVHNKMETHQNSAVNDSFMKKCGSSGKDNMASQNDDSNAAAKIRSSDSLNLCSSTKAEKTSNVFETALKAAPQQSSQPATGSVKMTAAIQQHELKEVNHIADPSLQRKTTLDQKEKTLPRQSSQPVNIVYPTIATKKESHVPQNSYSSNTASTTSSNSESDKSKSKPNSVNTGSNLLSQPAKSISEPFKASMKSGNADPNVQEEVKPPTVKPIFKMTPKIVKIEPAEAEERAKNNDTDGFYRKLLDIKKEVVEKLAAQANQNVSKTQLPASQTPCPVVGKSNDNRFGPAEEKPSAIKNGTPSLKSPMATLNSQTPHPLAGKSNEDRFGPAEEKPSAIKNDNPSLKRPMATELKMSLSTVKKGLPKEKTSPTANFDFNLLKIKKEIDTCVTNVKNAVNQLNFAAENRGTSGVKSCTLIASHNLQKAVPIEAMLQSTPAPNVLAIPIPSVTNRDPTIQHETRTVGKHQSVDMELSSPLVDGVQGSSKAAMQLLEPPQATTNVQNREAPQVTANLPQVEAPPQLMQTGNIVATPQLDQLHNYVMNPRIHPWPEFNGNSAGYSGGQPQNGSYPYMQRPLQEANPFHYPVPPEEMNRHQRQSGPRHRQHFHNVHPFHRHSRLPPRRYNEPNVSGRNVSHFPPNAHMNVMPHPNGVLPYPIPFPLPRIPPTNPEELHHAMMFIKYETERRICLTVEYMELWHRVEGQVRFEVESQGRNPVYPSYGN